MATTPETILEHFTKELTANVTVYVTEKILPAISEKFGISIEELALTVRGIDAIKAVPKPRTVGSPLASKSKDSILVKINAAKEQKKVLNVSSGRPLLDSVANRKKLTFYDDLGIAGAADDPKLAEIVAILRGEIIEAATPITDTKNTVEKKAGTNPVKLDEQPVHIQAAKAKERAAKTSAKKSESISFSNQPAASTSAEKKHVNEEDDSDVNVGSGSAGSKAPVSKKTALKEESESSEKEIVQTKKLDPKKQTPVMNDESDSSEKEIVQTKKKTPIEKEESETESEHDIPIKTPVKKQAPKESKLPTMSDDEDSDPKQIAETCEKISSQDQAVGESKTFITIPVKYVVKTKKWINVETNFVVLRKGISTIVIGKLANATSDTVLDLTKKDKQLCEKNCWQTAV